MIPRVVPAQLSFLAIYNPSLGPSDETLHDQIVFYYSKAARAAAKTQGDKSRASLDLRDQQNEQLRQVGLAQGMVGFARGFSKGEAVESIETEKSRIVLHELEPGWWILASVDLTQLPVEADSHSRSNDGSPDPARAATEHSSREVSTPALLVKQLIRANSVFLLHHGATLGTLFEKMGRAKFCSTLDRFWARFATHWDVLLHGSPAVDIFGGLKLAAGGELGMGVGEEEWGSGEREVLEDFARRTDGLVDLMVSRFGEPSPHQRQAAEPAETKSGAHTLEAEPWIGRGKNVGTGDGVVFSGVGALSRSALRDLSRWVEDIYSFGEYAYGVKDSAMADRRRRRRKKQEPSEASQSEADTKNGRAPSSVPQATPRRPSPSIPPPIVKAAESSLDKASDAVSNARASPSESSKIALSDTETWVKYLTLGYGTAWGGQRAENGDKKATTKTESQGELSAEAPMRYVEPEPDVDRLGEKIKRQVELENSGYFIIGLKGRMEEEEPGNEESDDDWNNRILIRTVHVEPLSDAPLSTSTDQEKAEYEKELMTTPDSKRAKRRLRPVIYVHRPFIYTFLFDPRTESLSLSAFYRNLHTYLSPLHQPLNHSTSPDRVRARLLAASHPYTTSPSSKRSFNTQPIYDLVYDPRSLTVHSSLPNIPEPGTLVAEGLGNTGTHAEWSRADALNVHSQILATVADTRHTYSEIERTCKTSRGWWVVWLRLPPSSAEVMPDTEVEPRAETGFNVDELREGFLVRRAQDGAAGSSSGSSGTGLSRGLWGLGQTSTSAKMGGTAAGWGPRGLTEGVGIDARRYVESLLSLSR